MGTLVIGETVTVRVPPKAGYMALLRTAVGGFAARDRFTIDQVDDLRMAVEEAGVQLLRHAVGDWIALDITSTGAGIEIRLRAPVPGPGPVIDASSFSWSILSALSDELSVETDQQETTVVLRKHRLAGADARQAAPQ